jgi:hypothetical protein
MAASDPDEIQMIFSFTFQLEIVHKSDLHRFLIELNYFTFVCWSATCSKKQVLEVQAASWRMG